MATTPEKPRRPAKRADDRRGTPPGKAVMEGPGTSKGGGKGRIGNPPFVPTEEQRQLVRTLAKAFPIHNEHFIAARAGISYSTLHRHFKDDMVIGRAEMLAAVGSQMISRAINADARDANGQLIAKGDIEAQKFVLSRLGGWTTKVEHYDRGDRPLETEVDLSWMTLEELEEYARLVERKEAEEAAETVGDNE